jgi:hypothetical protein
MPEAFMAEIQKRQDGSATAVPSNGVEYLVTTSVGGQNLNLDFDTGSADLYVIQELWLIKLISCQMGVLFAPPLKREEGPQYLYLI